MSKGLKIFNIEITDLRLDQFSSFVRDVLEDSVQPFLLACANPHSLVESLKDDIFYKALKRTDLLVADGIGVVLVGRYLKRKPVEKITGSDVYSLTMRELERCKGSVYFFGSSEVVLKRISHRICEDFPNIRLAGTLSPPFGDWSQEKNNEMIKEINQADVDVLWVGMTAPKQEKWVLQNIEHLNVKLIGSIGAVFDFYAETKPRAPSWMCKIGMEWLHRLLAEPKRMWRRNFISTPLFLFLVIKEMIGMRLNAK